jgi:superfamily II DNA or RNA helicase
MTDIPDRPVLRDYQKQAVDAVLACKAEGKRRVMMVMATGTGKTVAFADLIRRWPGEGTSLVLAHRGELLDQAADKIREAMPDATISVEKAEQSAYWGSDVIVASIQTLAQNGARRAKRLVEKMDIGLVVYDEVHHAAAPGNKSVLKALGCWDEGGPFLLGCTATPNRGDKKTLGRIFEGEAYNLGIRDAIAGGWLCPISAYRVETGTDLADVGTTAGDFITSQLSAAVNHRERSLMAVEYWKKLCPGRPTLAFCVDVKHAIDTAELFLEQGVRAAAVSGKTDPEERAILLQEFRDGHIDVLCNCALLTEGVDLPKVSCVIMLRPTKSSSLYSQCMGRGTRIFPGKENLLVIDLVDNCRRNKLVTAPVIFGLPDTMDVAGKRLDQVRDKVDASGVPPSRLEGMRSVEQLNHKCEEWDLFSDHELPDDIRRLTNRIWAPWREGYRLVIAGAGEARIQQDDLGRYTAEIYQGDKQLGSRSVDGIEEAFRLSDRAVERQWGSSADWTRTKAKWIKEPASQKQIGFLRRSGVPEDMLKDLSKGKGSSMIERLMQKKEKTSGV